MANFTVTVYTGITIVCQFERMIILKCDETVCILYIIFCGFSPVHTAIMYFLTLLKGQGHEIRMA